MSSSLSSPAHPPDMPKGRKNGNKDSKPSIQIPKAKTKSSPGQSPITPVTPKTPADEGLDFFQGQVNPGESAIRVYELRLDSDGGPSKELAVRDLLITSTTIVLTSPNRSTSVYPQHTRPTFSAFLYRRARPPRRTVCSRPTFPWMAESLDAISSPRKRE